jgi:hypothetical protein
MKNEDIYLFWISFQLVIPGSSCSTGSDVAHAHEYNFFNFFNFINVSVVSIHSLHKNKLPTFLEIVNGYRKFYFLTFNFSRERDRTQFKAVILLVTGLLYK